MKDRGLTLFVSQSKESDEAVRLLKMGYPKLVVVPHPPDMVAAGLQPELQIGKSSNNRVRGFQKIKEWLDSQVATKTA